MFKFIHKNVEADGEESKRLRKNEMARINYKKRVGRKKKDNWNKLMMEFYAAAKAREEQKIIEEIANKQKTIKKKIEEPKYL